MLFLEHFFQNSDLFFVTCHLFVSPSYSFFFLTYFSPKWEAKNGMLIHFRMPKVCDFVTWLNCHWTTNLLYFFFIFFYQRDIRWIKQPELMSELLAELNSASMKNKRRLKDWTTNHHSYDAFTARLLIISTSSWLLWFAPCCAESSTAPWPTH